VRRDFHAWASLLCALFLLGTGSLAHAAPDFPRVDAIQRGLPDSPNTYAASRRWFESYPFKERVFLQLSLILVGQYNGLADGVFGRNTFNALRQFQREADRHADGVLSADEEDLLVRKAAAVYRLFGFEKTTDAATGLTFFAPLALTTETSSTRRGSSWKSRSGQLEIESLSIPDAEISYLDLYSRLIAENRHRRVTYSTVGDRFFVVSGMDGEQNFYVKIDRASGRSVGFSLSWTAQVDTIGKRLAVFMASMASVSDAAPERYTRDGGTANPAAPSAGGKREPGSGSGFFVSDTGLVVTNHHVITGCRSIEVPGHGRATVITSDADKDLAAIRVRPAAPVVPAQLADSRPALGQPVIVAGFPLPESLGANLLISSGIVSGETGIGGAPHQFSVSASIHPGNSGGPVLDNAGHVVGVAFAKLNELAILAETGGATGSGIGFVVDTETLLDFLVPFDKQVAHSKPAGDQGQQSAVARAKKFTVQVICR